MKVQILSDVHFEFHADGGDSFVDGLEPSETDVLVLAGDIGSLRDLRAQVPRLCERYRHVVYVKGNHEHYGRRREELNDGLEALQDTHEGFHFLHDSAVTIDGQRFVGGTLWFPDTKAARQLTQTMSDFDRIPDAEDWIWGAFEEAVEFLSSELRGSDVLVTHHLPSFQSVAPRYRTFASNCYFVGDIEPLLADRQPKLCIHGHTHESLDYQIGEARVVCNPFGYVRQELNPNFVERLVVEL